MSQIITKDREVGWIPIGYHCDGCGREYRSLTYLKEPESYNWFVFDDKHYCPECTEIEFVRCVRCKELKPSGDVNTVFLCQDCL